MASPTQWTWIWVNSESCRWTGRPGMLQSMGSQRVRHDWATELTDVWLTSLIMMSFKSIYVVAKGTLLSLSLLRLNNIPSCIDVDNILFSYDDAAGTSLSSWIGTGLQPRWKWYCVTLKSMSQTWDSILLILPPDTCLEIPELTYRLHHLLWWRDHKEGLLRDRKRCPKSPVVPAFSLWVFWLRSPKDQHPHCASLDLFTCTVWAE